MASNHQNKQILKLVLIMIWGWWGSPCPNAMKLGTNQSHQQRYIIFIWTKQH